MKSLIEYVNPLDVRQLVDDFEALTPTLYRDKGFVREYLGSPGVRTATVTIDGDRAYIIAFRITNDHGFWLDICKAVSGNKMPQLVEIINGLARSLGARYIRFTTARRALVELAQKYGYQSEAVLMTKAVT